MVHREFENPYNAFQKINTQSNRTEDSKCVANGFADERDGCGMAFT